MKPSPELYDLALVAMATALMWIPYVLAMIWRAGLWKTMGNRDHALPGLPLWAQRARRAHANAVENLAVFAPLLLVAASTGLASPLVRTAASTYLVARLVHYVVYAAGVPVVRTLAFFAGWGATLAVAMALLMS
ncbi:MAPEG family protein [Dyella sedimenti]|uniref:MAPEG family protein n=1 Tax=Dyella sedimenti TaxID=2919947 RepID=UPI001FAA3A8F|nr:MAPEG family protein [Dyella sedimenti]